MARPLRLEFAGALYHVTSRRDRREDIYEEEDIVDEMLTLIETDRELSEVPSSQRRPLPLDLSHYRRQNPDRNSAIYEAYRSGGYTMKELGEYFGLHYATVSGIIRNHKSKT